jgi:hypothetical protein
LQLFMVVSGQGGHPGCATFVLWGIRVGDLLVLDAYLSHIPLTLHPIVIVIVLVIASKINGILYSRLLINECTHEQPIQEPILFSLLSILTVLACPSHY